MAVRVNALTLITATRCTWGGGRWGRVGLGASRGVGAAPGWRGEGSGGVVHLAGVDAADDAELFGSEAEDDGRERVAQREARHVEDLVRAEQHARRGGLGVERGAQLAQKLRRAGRRGWRLG